jgi:hypothetical protein
MPRAKGVYLQKTEYAQEVRSGLCGCPLAAPEGNPAIGR